MTDVEALCEPEAMDSLEALASIVPADQSIVELGVYQGASLARLAAGAVSGNGARVYGIDPWAAVGAYPGRPHMLRRYPITGLAKTISHLTDLGLDQHVTLIKGLSHEEAQHWGREQVGLLFIDAIHREREVLVDFYSWLPHLAEGAVVCFDDHDERFDGVRRAVAQIVEAGDLYWIELVGSRLAVLARPGSGTLIPNNPSQGARENGRESK